MTSEDKEIPQAKATRERSPSFPFISLRTAVDRLIAFEGKFGRHPVPALKAGLAWAMKPESSQAAQTLAALKSFAMVEYTGLGEKRVATLTEEARTFIRAQQSSIKAEILRSWALRPKNIARYFQEWGRDRPIDEICLDQLVIKDEFTEGAAKTFLRVYDDSVSYAGLASADKLSEDPLEDLAEPEGEALKSEAPGQKQETAMTAAAITPTQSIAPVPALIAAVGVRQDTFSLDEGLAVLQWPSQLSASSYEDFKDWIELQLRKIKRSIPDRAE